MNVFDLVATIRLDSKDYEKGLSDAEGKTSKVASGIKSGLATAGKVAAAGIGAAVTAVGALTKKAVEGYSNYEQLSGGIKKLYGNAGMSLSEYAKSVGKSEKDVEGKFKSLDKAQNAVLENAKNAFRTAGMSANDYMETATQFSSSLIKSLGGDTEAAADLTDKALRDMSDNVNTFGSNMEDVQNAYKGFAKDNYTMLDNLKLGYAGSKTGAQQLVEDAAKAKDAQKELGLTVDANSLSFDNLVKAIEVVQKQQGIYGTTTREAATTVEGSMTMVKAAWENLLAGMANPDVDLDTLFGNLIDSLVGYEDEAGEHIKGFLDNIAPVIERALQAVGELVTKVAPVIAEKLPEVAEQLLPPLMASAGSLLGSLVAALPTLLQAVWDALPSLASTFWESLKTALSDATGGKSDEIGSIVTGVLGDSFSHLGDSFGELKDVIGEILSPIGDFFSQITDNTDPMETFRSIMERLDDVIDSLADGISTFASGLSAFWDVLSEGTLEDIVPNFEKLKDAIQKLIDTVKDITGFDDFTKKLKDSKSPSDALKTALDLLRGVIKGIGDIIGGVADGISDFADGLKNAHDWADKNPEVIDGITAAIATLTAGIIAFNIQNGIASAGGLAKLIFSIGNSSIVVGAYTVATDLATAATTAFGAVMSFVTSPIGAVTLAIIAVIAIGVLLAKNWDKISAAAQKLGDKLGKIWEGIKTKIGDLAGKIFSSVSEKFNSLKDKVGSIFSKIKDAMTHPVEAAKSKISGIIDRIKGFFSGLHLSIPSIKLPKLPHFSLNGKFSLNPPSVPHLAVDWYAKGGIFNNPSLIGVGEAGPEAVLPIEKLKTWIDAMGEHIKSDSGISGTWNITMNISGAEDPEEWGRRFVDEVAQAARQGV